MTQRSAYSGLRKSPLWAALMHLVRPFARLLPQSVWSHLWFSGPFTVRVGPGRLRLHHGGEIIENEFFWTGTFWTERATIAYFLDLVRQADILIDVGANIGTFALVAKAAKPELQVIAIEPSETNFAALARNIRINGFDIQALNAAVTATDGPVTLYDFAGVSYSASLESDWREGTVARQVDGLSLDTVTAGVPDNGQRILLKIDVEGHEPQALAGARKLIARRQRAAFVIELIRDPVVDAVVKLLPAGTYRYLLVDEEAGTLTDLTESMASKSPRRHGNYVIVPDGWSVPSRPPRMVSR